MDETGDRKQFPHQKGVKDATGDVAKEIPHGRRRPVNAVKIREGLENIGAVTEEAFQDVTKQIKEKGKIGGTKIG